MMKRIADWNGVMKPAIREICAGGLRQSKLAMGTDSGCYDLADGAGACNCRTADHLLLHTQECGR